MSTSSDAVDMAAFARARGPAPQATAVMRRHAADFRVTEDCAVELSGSGEHLWLYVEKTGLTTMQAVDALAGAAHVHPRHIGFSGLKDRWAVTRQWFSLPWPIARGDAPFVLDERGTARYAAAHGDMQLLEQSRHDRKLKRGAHRANAFELTLRDVSGERDVIEADLARIAAAGVPNYFGEQRFGVGGRNLALSHALFDGKRLRRNQRGFALSAARSLVFNTVLDARVRAGSWNRIMDGEAIMLAGSHSVFGETGAGQDAAALQQRLDAFDIHPSGPLPGMAGNAPLTGAALELEQAVLAEHGRLVNGLVQAQVMAARRALRLDTRNLEWAWLTADTLVLRFELPPGAYATSLLREVLATSES